MQHIQDITEAYCDDCGFVCFITELNGERVSHCSYCGGVNVNEYSMSLQQYLEDTHGDIELTRKHQKEKIWNRIKNLNTDDELDEIESLLFS